jgi:hypothetical protein
LASALSLEIASGAVRVLPLLVGGADEKQSILAELPLLNNKLYLAWEGGPASVVTAIRRRLNIRRGPLGEEALSPSKHVPSVSYCNRCGATVGSPTECVGSLVFHNFVHATGKEFCNRCGATIGKPTTCTGSLVFHNFVQGTSREFCNRCGATIGKPTTCTGSLVFHNFVQGTGKEFCNRCGTSIGKPTTCTGSLVYHNFI